MRKWSSIILLLLILSPVLRNGLHLLYHLVPQTHAFCIDDSEEHSHEIADCAHIHSLADYQPNQPNQQKAIPSEYYELKTCITEQPTINHLILGLTNPTNFIESILLEKSFSDDIFHPPII